MGKSDKSFFDAPSEKAVVSEVSAVKPVKEINSLAKEALLKQVDNELRRLTEDQSDNKQMLQLLVEIKDVVTRNGQEDMKTAALKRDVLTRIKANLETLF